METLSTFLDFCDNGGLVRPSVCIYKICLETEKQLNIATDGYTELSINQLDLKIITKVKNNFDLDSSIFPKLTCNDTGILDIPHKI